MDWEWFGQAGHFCCAYDCNFHLHTHIGGFCISTVGEWFPSRGKNGELGKMADVSPGRQYETMVFRVLEDGDIHLQEIEADRYTNRDAARDGHMAMCRKYEAEASKLSPAELW